jgi:membrane protein YdbS with pleckstrin-like domain
MKEIASVGSAHDIRVHCAEQAKARAAKVLASCFMLSILVFVYLATALVAFFLGKSPWPGSVAALVVCVWVAFLLLVRLPFASREHAILDVDK